MSILINNVKLLVTLKTQLKLIVKHLNFIQFS